MTLVQIKKLEVKKYAKEIYLSYILLCKSENQHNKLKLYFQNNFTTVDYLALGLSIRAFPTMSDRCAHA